MTCKSWYDDTKSDNAMTDIELNRNQISLRFSDFEFRKLHV